jgi:hypothetical protein
MAKGRRLAIKERWSSDAIIDKGGKGFKLQTLDIEW